MNRFATGVFASNLLVCGLLLAMLGWPFEAQGKRGSAAADESTALQADREFVHAAAKGDAATVAKLLDADFKWTNTEGKTLSRTPVLYSLPTPALGNEAGAREERQPHSQVEAIMVHRDQIHILRVWVKRGSAWRLLVVHEITLGHESAGASDAGMRECDNPCKTVPYKPKNEVEQAILASWQALETGVANRDALAWAPHIAEEFMMLGSTNDHPLTKADRIATLDMQKQTGRSSLPPPVVSMQLYEFGDAAVMTCVHQPYTGKPVRVTRLWIKHDGKWVMSLSFQTTIQAAPAKAS